MEATKVMSSAMLGGSLTIEEALERESYLYNALVRASGTGYFTAGECIRINQERGYLLSVGEENELKYNEVPKEIERKIEILFGIL